MSVNLLDVVTVPRVVKTAKYGDLNVSGLSVKGIAFLIKRHPELFKVFDQNGNSDFDTSKIIDLGVEVVTDFLCAGLGYPGGSDGYDKAYKLCENMNADDAFSLIEAILDESFPKGAANFFERVTKAINSAGVMQEQLEAQPEEEKKVAQAS